MTFKKECKCGCDESMCCSKTNHEIIKERAKRTLDKAIERNVKERNWECECKSKCECKYKPEDLCPDCRKELGLEEYLNDGWVELVYGDVVKVVKPERLDEDEYDDDAKFWEWEIGYITDYVFNDEEWEYLYRVCIPTYGDRHYAWLCNCYLTPIDDEVDFDLFIDNLSWNSLTE